MSPKIPESRGSVCRNDSTTNRTDKARKIHPLITKIQYLIKILGVINAFQKQRGVSMAGMGGHLAPEWGVTIGRNIHQFNEQDTDKIDVSDKYKMDMSKFVNDGSMSQIVQININYSSFGVGFIHDKSIFMRLS